MKTDEKQKTVGVADCRILMDQNVERARRILDRPVLTAKDCYDLSKIGSAISFLAGNVAGICEVLEDEL